MQHDDHADDVEFLLVNARVVEHAQFDELEQVLFEVALDVEDLLAALGELGVPTPVLGFEYTTFLESIRTSTPKEKPAGAANGLDHQKSPGFL